MHIKLIGLFTYVSSPYFLKKSAESITYCYKVKIKCGRRIKVKARSI